MCDVVQQGLLICKKEKKSVELLLREFFALNIPIC